MDEWDLSPGDRIERKELHAKYGGRTQGGIGPSKSSPNVLLFADPLSARKHGYTDGEHEDGCFHYTGEGQRGDQTLKSGNAAILRHREEGRALRLFTGARGIVTYKGQYEIDPNQPFYTTDAPESGEGSVRPVRSVIVFRLRKVDGAPGVGSGSPIPLKTDQVEEVPIESNLTERAVVEPDREPYEAERREAKLVAEFDRHMYGLGHMAKRLRVTPAGEAKPLYTDLYVPGLNLLVEAKGTVERGSIRMALGQLLDYRRFIPGVRCAVLLPARPREDLLRLVLGVGVDLYWQDGGTFHHEPSQIEQLREV
jgi:hypothetical protein